MQMTVSHVSSRWRSIAIDTSKLWENLHVVLDNDGQQAEVALKLASVWLSRGRNSMLSFVLSSNLLMEDPTYWRLRKLISSHQFKELIIRSIEPELLDSEAYKKSVRCLEKLSLKLPPAFEPPPHEKLTIFSSNRRFHCLTSLVLEFGNPDEIDWGNVINAMPWRQLEVLKFSPELAIPLVVSILRLCRSLVECDMWVYQPHNTTYLPPRGSIRLPNLRVLDITSPDGEEQDVVSIVGALNAPNLRSLSLDSFQPCLFERGFEWMASELGEKFRRLSHFSLWLTRSVYDMGLVLSFMPALRWLQFKGPALELHEGIIRRLSIGDLAPQLEELIIQDYFGNPETMLDMIENRQRNAGHRPIAPFVHVFFGFKNFEDEILTNGFMARVAHIMRKYNVKITAEPGSQDMWIYSDDE